MIDSKARGARWAAIMYVICLLGGIIAVEPVIAGDFPSKVLTIIVPFPPGGGADVQARLIAKGLAERLEQPVIIDNRPGAGGRIGANLAARAAPDGHTLFVGSLTTLVIEQVLRTNVDYDPQRDFAPISLISEEPFLLVVSSSLPVKNVAELLAYAQSHQLTYGSFGPGSSAHLVAEMFKAAARVDILHIPFKGAVPAITDVIGGHVSMMFANALTATPYIRSGQLRALAVTGPTRLGILPTVPTLAESAVSGIDLKLWYGLVVPAKTPPDIVAKLHKAITELLKGAEFKAFVQNLGADAIPSSPKEMKQRILSDSETIRSLVSRINFHVDE